jgi:hypothetical protein
MSPCSKEVGLEINVEKTKYMLLSRYQIAGQNRNIKNANVSFENVSQFKYLGMPVTKQNLIQEEIKRRFNSGNACYHSVQSLLSSRLLSKNLKIRIYETVILPVVLYGCKTWSLTLREEHKLRMFESSTNGEKRNAYRLLVGKPERKRPLGRPRRRWVDNIRMDLGEVGWGDMDWIDLAKDRNRWRALVSSVLSLRVP